MQPTTVTGRKRAAFLAISLALCLALFEAGSFVAVRIVAGRGWMADVPSFTEPQIAVYLRDRDRTLGWAFVTDTLWGPATNADGRVTRPIARPDPAAGRASGVCASTYGDSFVYGTEAPNSASYPHHLGVLLGCDVRNYGVPGYGSDQALMLYRAQATLDSAPVVIFQHLTENVLRNVNRYANLLYPGSPLRFKPRFVLEGDSLVYLAAPVQSAADFPRVTSNPDSALAPDGLLTRPRPGFPFTVTLLRWLATDFKLRARLTQVPSEAGYYALDHPAGGFPLSAAIMTAAVRDAAAQGKRGIILLQTTRQGLIYARDEGRWIDAPLYDTLTARGLPVIHAGPYVLRALGSRHPCEIFDGCSITHMNSEGNRMVAEVVADYLRTAGLAAPPTKPAASPAASGPE